MFRRQDAPSVYAITPIAYVVKPEYVLKNKRLFDGRVGYVEMPPERAIDVDTKLDFELAEFFLSKRESGKKSF